MVAAQTLTELFDLAHKEACAAFERKDVDISVVRDAEAEEDRRFVARAVLNHTLVMATEPSPEEALERLIRLIIAKAGSVPAHVEHRARDIRATMPTLAPIEGAK